MFSTLFINIFAKAHLNIFIDSASTDESNSDKELLCMNFIFTFSPEEWKEI